MDEEVVLAVHSGVTCSWFLLMSRMFPASQVCAELSEGENGSSRQVSVLRAFKPTALCSLGLEKVLLEATSALDSVCLF